MEDASHLDCSERTITKNPFLGNKKGYIVCITDKVYY